MMNASPSSYWGEIDGDNDDSGIAALERTQISKIRPLKISSPPSAYSTNVADTVGHLTNESGLINHINQLIRYIKYQERSVDTTEMTSFHPVIFPSCIEGCSKALTVTKKTLGYVPRAQNIHLIPANSQLPLESLRPMLQRTVIALAASQGYETTDTEIVAYLADLTGSFLERFTARLRQLQNARLESGSSGYPDVFDRCLQDSGFSHGVTDLHTAWLASLRTHERLVSRADTLRADAAKQTASDRQSGYAPLDDVTARPAGNSPPPPPAESEQMDLTDAQQ